METVLENGNGGCSIIVQHVQKIFGGLLDPFYTSETYEKMVRLLKQLKEEDEIEVTLNPQEDDLCKLCGNLNKRPECQNVEGEEIYCKKYKIEVGESYTVRDLLSRGLIKIGYCKQ